MTLMEVLVTLAIVLGLTVVMVPTVSNVLALEQRAAAREIALAFERLHDEAVLRNKSFRIVFDLDRHRWFVEEAEAGAMIFATPEDREAWEKEFGDKVEEMDDAAKRTWLQQRQFKPIAKSDRLGGFRELPPDVWFESVYTPQYEDPIRPARDRERLEEGEVDPDEPPNIASVHLFANGFVEHAVIRIVEGDEVDEGYSITVDPMSGRVRMLPELIDHDDMLDFLPSEGPRLP